MLAALLVRQLDYVPFSDTAEYADCVLDAVRFGDPTALNCADHPTWAYLGLLAISQALAPGSPVALLLTNFALACGFLAFASVPIARVVGNRPAALAVGLLGLAVQPVLAVDWVQFSADTGVTLAALPFLWFLAERRMVLAALVGTATVFTKETGWVLVGFAGGLSAAVDVWRRGSAGLRSHLPLALPAAAVAAWILGRHSASSDGTEGAVLWHSIGTEEMLASATDTVTVGRLLAGFLANLSVLEFGWLVAPFVVVSLLRRVPRAVSGSDEVLDRFALVSVAAIGVVPVLALLPILHAPPRYTAWLLPVLWLLGVDGFVSTVTRPPARVIGLGAMCALWFVSCFRTFDPVSRALFGTFPFGAHDLLYMTSIARDWPGPGEDHLAYNFEFFYLPRLVDQALRDLQPPESALLVFPPNAAWRVAHRLDTTTHGRTYAHDGAYPAQVLGEVVNPYHPDTTILYGFEMANGVWPEFREFLEGRSSVHTSLVYELDGYTLTVHLANGAVPPS